MITLTVGTSNQQKVGFFRTLMEGLPVMVQGCDPSLKPPEETGSDPIGNALQKLDFYGRYYDNVICADSGLYFADLPENDPRQPGLHVRSPFGKRLDDEETIAYYAQLVHSLGGAMTAYYLDGTAMRLNGQTYTFLPTKEELLSTAFTLTDTPCEARRQGWPLDSLSVDYRGIPFLSPERQGNAQVAWSYQPRLRAFVREKLGV